MLDKIKLFYFHAKGKVTTYVGLLIASAGEIRNEWPDALSNLPQWPSIVWIENHVLSHIFVALGFLVVYTRVRRLLKDAP